MRYILSLTLVLFTISSQALDIRIASWNIQRLGHGQHKDYPALGRIAAQFDFLAIQEVMTQDGLERLAEAVAQASGERWEIMHSHRIGRGSHKEKYAFLWRSAAVEYIDGAVVYLDVGDRFAREPYSARFRSIATGVEFVAATVHIVFGKSTRDRLPEILALRDYWNWLGDIYPGVEARFLLGDFNLAQSHSAWTPFKAVARPLLTTGASTLSSIDGRYANLYDNIWVPRPLALPVVEAGIYRFPELLGWTHETARRHVSDHAPVYVTLGRAHQAPAR